jgi:hypothetical protein
MPETHSQYEKFKNLIKEMFFFPGWTNDLEIYKDWSIIFNSSYLKIDALDSIWLNKGGIEDYLKVTALTREALNYMLNLANNLSANHFAESMPTLIINKKYAAVALTDNKIIFTSDTDFASRAETVFKIEKFNEEFIEACASEDEKIQHLEKMVKYIQLDLREFERFENHLTQLKALKVGVLLTQSQTNYMAALSLLVEVCYHTEPQCIKLDKLWVLIHELKSNKSLSKAAVLMKTLDDKSRQIYNLLKGIAEKKYIEEEKINGLVAKIADKSELGYLIDKDKLTSRALQIKSLASIKSPADIISSSIFNKISMFIAFLLEPTALIYVIVHAQSLNPKLKTLPPDINPTASSAAVMLTKYFNRDAFIKTYSAAQALPGIESQLALRNLYLDILSATLACLSFMNNSSKNKLLLNQDFVSHIRWANNYGNNVIKIQMSISPICKDMFVMSTNKTLTRVRQLNKYILQSKLAEELSFIYQNKENQDAEVSARIDGLIRSFIEIIEVCFEQIMVISEATDKQENTIKEDHAQYRINLIEDVLDNRVYAGLFSNALNKIIEKEKSSPSQALNLYRQLNVFLESFLKIQPNLFNILKNVNLRDRWQIGVDQILRSVTKSNFIDYDFLTVNMKLLYLYTEEFSFYKEELLNYISHFKHAVEYCLNYEKEYAADIAERKILLNQVIAKTVISAILLVKAKEQEVILTPTAAPAVGNQKEKNKNKKHKKSGKSGKSGTFRPIKTTEESVILTPAKPDYSNLFTRINEGLKDIKYSLEVAKKHHRGLETQVKSDSLSPENNNFAEQLQTLQDQVNEFEQSYPNVESLSELEASVRDNIITHITSVQAKIDLLQKDMKAKAVEFYKLSKLTKYQKSQLEKAKTKLKLIIESDQEEEKVELEPILTVSPPPLTSSPQLLSPSSVQIAVVFKGNIEKQIALTPKPAIPKPEVILSPLQTTYLLKACQHFLYLNKIFQQDPSNMPSPKIYYAKLFCIFNCFQSLTRYLQDIEEFRVGDETVNLYLQKMIFNIGIASKKNFTIVCELASLFNCQLPVDLTQFVGIWDPQLSVEQIKRLLASLAGHDSSACLNSQIYEIYERLVDFFETKIKAPKVIFTEVEKADYLIEKINRTIYFISLYPMLHFNTTYSYLDYYLIELQALRMMIACCGELYPRYNASNAKVVDFLDESRVFLGTMIFDEYEPENPEKVLGFIKKVTSAVVAIEYDKEVTRVPSYFTTPVTFFSVNTISSAAVPTDVKNTWTARRFG